MPNPRIIFYHYLEEDPSPLHVRLAVECVAAGLSALSVAPAISIVDKAIVSNASGLEPLLPCIYNGCVSFLTNPIYFVRQPSFIFIFGVYGGTYIVGNSIDAICERAKTSAFYPKFVGSSIANVTLSILKDKAFARMFGKGSPRPIPAMTYGLFAARDSLTILAGFSLPAVISRSMQDAGWNKGRADTLSQLATPVAMQIISTPMHLHALDLYNRSNETVAERINFIRREYFKTMLARMARIFPAYGVGGVVNKKLRKEGLERMFQMYPKPTSA